MSGTSTVKLEQLEWKAVKYPEAPYDKSHFSAKPLGRIKSKGESFSTRTVKEQPLALQLMFLSQRTCPMTKTRQKINLMYQEVC